MNKCILLALALFASSALFAQIRYEPGYYLDVNGNKVSGLIRNVGWKDNPKAIDFKASEDAQSVAVPFAQMSEFAIGDGPVYQKFDIRYDSSPSNTESLTSSAAPSWQNETAMLKILAEGELNLYEYSDRSLLLFFVKETSQPKPDQLVFKEYLTGDSNIAQNNYFRQQLYNLMRQKGFSRAEFEKLRYKRDDLAKLVDKFNGNEQKNLASRKSKTDYNLRAIVGASSSKLMIEQTYDGFEVDLGNSAVPVIGFEAEVVFGFNQGKWSVFTGATYQSYKGDKVDHANYTFSADYKFVEVPIAIRHSFFLSPKSRIFVNAGFNLAFSIDSKISAHNNITDTELNGMDLERSSNFMAGAGFAYGRFGLELRFHGKRDTVSKMMYWNADYSSTSALLSYKIF